MDPESEIKFELNHYKVSPPLQPQSESVENQMFV